MSLDFTQTLTLNCTASGPWGPGVTKNFDLTINRVVNIVHISFPDFSGTATTSSKITITKSIPAYICPFGVSFTFPIIVLDASTHKFGACIMSSMGFDIGVFEGGVGVSDFSNHDNAGVVQCTIAHKLV